jgi:hypothetical protein
VVHTPGVPPNQGRMNLAIIGSTWNSRKALRKIVTTYVRIEPATAPYHRGTVSQRTIGSEVKLLKR